MSFSRLLFVAANSKKQIVGEGNDKVIISANNSIANRDPYQGEVILCFQLDDRNDKEKRVLHSLGISDEDQRCDGLVFYSRDEQTHRVICLVEMKSKNITEAGKQIIATKRHLEDILGKECDALHEKYRTGAIKQITNIRWKAGFYHYGGSGDEVEKILLDLKKNHGFDGADHFTYAENDLRPLLTGVGGSAKELSKKYKQKHNKRR
jgi:hypothetical protein